MHISGASEEALDLLLAECEERAYQIDGMRGPISDAARPWSHTIDRIEAERDTGGLTSRSWSATR